MSERKDAVRNSGLWQLVKFNLVSTGVTAVQLALANLLPLVFDGVTAPLPGFLRGIFDPAALFDGPTAYVAAGSVTWGYVLPFFLSNLLANILGYYLNMRATFRGRGKRWSLAVYLAVLSALILFSTWLQGALTARLLRGVLKRWARSAAAMAAGLVQLAVLFPLEKYVLFKPE